MKIFAALGCAAVIGAAVDKAVASPYKGVEAGTCFRSLVPARTPAAIVARTSAETARVLNKPDMRERLASADEQVTPGPEAFAALRKADHAKWGKIVREANVKVE